MEALRKFVLRAKVTNRRCRRTSLCGGRAWRCKHLTSAGLAAPYGLTVTSRREGIGVATRAIATPAATGSSALRRNWRSTDSPATPIAAEQIEHDWRLADIRAGLPQIYLATREAFVAQMLNLDVLDGISFSKGCYTGQEIIARTQHLGRIKRRLYRLRLPRGEWRIGQALRLSDGRAGRLVEAIEAAEASKRWPCSMCRPTRTATRGHRRPSPTATLRRPGRRAAPLPLPYESGRIADGRAWPACDRGSAVARKCRGYASAIASIRDSVRGACPALGTIMRSTSAVAFSGLAVKGGLRGGFASEHPSCWKPTQFVRNAILHLWISEVGLYSARMSVDYIPRVTCVRHTCL